MPLLVFGFLFGADDFPSDELLYLLFFHGSKGKNILRKKSMFRVRKYIFKDPDPRGQLFTDPDGCYLDIFVAIEKNMLTNR